MQFDYTLFCTSLEYKTLHIGRELLDRTQVSLCLLAGCPLLVSDVQPIFVDLLCVIFSYYYFYHIIIRCNYDFNWMWTSTPCELSCNTAQGGVGSTTSGYRVHLGFSGSAPPGPCQKPTSTPAAVCLPSTLFILVSPLIIRLPLAAFTPPSGNWPETLLKSARYFPYYLKQTADDVGSVQSCPISLATYL